MFRDLRIANGMRQQEVADEVGVDRLTVGKWEQGRAFPRPEVLVKLMNLYQVDIGVFYEELIQESK